MNNSTNQNKAGDLISRDAVVKVEFTSGHMQAEVRIEPPEGNGNGVTRPMLEAALKQAGVVFGINPDAVDYLLEPRYNSKVVVARGTQSVDGEDGVCKELFPRESIPKFNERADGTMDYKELGLITDVPAGTVVCEVTMPTEGQDGMNVQGKPIKARVGRKPPLPIGEGVRLSADGLRVETIASGNLVFRGSRFCVDPVYRVQDIDYDVGNITFSGDVMVNGDMLDGFEIHAGGNVTLRGRVGAVVIVAKNIRLEQGINGTGKAVLEAENEIKAGFIENCTVRAGTKIIADSIINSQVECEGDVEVTNKRGLICGGKITAYGSVVANEIGNESNTLTVIVLGITPRLLKERKKMEEQLADVRHHIDEMSKNVAYIQRLVADGRPVPPDRVSMLQRAQITLPITEKKRDQLEQSIAKLEARLADVSHSSLRARLLYPPTKISIGALSTNCIETRSMCKVYRDSQGELVFGSY